MLPTVPRQGLSLLVGVKRCVDYAVKIRIRPDGKGVDTDVKNSMNPFDEIAVEEAVRLREKHKGEISRIAAVSIGPAKAADVLRQALAMGADDAIHVEVAKDAVLEPLAVSKILAAVTRKEMEKKGDEKEAWAWTLGKQAIDDDASQTGQMLAAKLDWLQATFASKLEFKGAFAKGEKVEVTREVDGGLATVQTTLPFVLTTDLRLNEPRYASLPNIMKAKKKPFQKLTLKDLGLEEDAKPRLETLEVKEPPKRQGGAKVGSVDELVSKLQEAGRI